MSLAANLRRLRMNAKISAKAFANQIGINYANYRAYENGVWPNEKTLVTIADAFHVSIDELLGHSLKKFDEYKEILHDITTENGLIFRVREEPSSKKPSPVVVLICNKETGEEVSRVSFSSKNEFIYFMKPMIRISENTARMVLHQVIAESLQFRQEEEEKEV